MGCDQPLTGYRSREIGKSGKRGITFDRNASFSAIPIKLPCGRCIGCRLERSRQWAIRCMHEKALYDRNVFLTLTYDDKHLPEGGTLVRRDPQLFLKRLRDEYGSGIRFYGCGEYGEKSNRPHYHFILFNFDVDDKKFYKNAGHGSKLYTSSAIAKLWPAGFNVLGDVTFKSCAYVSRYIADKITGDLADNHYGGRLPEFSMMSRRPGIGSAWFDKYGKHAYQHDSVIMNGREVRPPRFYDTRYEVVDLKHFEALKRIRRLKAVSNKDNSSARRHVKEEVLRLNLKAKIREL